MTDRTTRGLQLCGDGHYTYDNDINPFSNFGYTDYLLTNLSINNKLSENVNYINCAFPSFIPSSRSYAYNDSGYPTLITTFSTPARLFPEVKRKSFINK